jgi:predicted transcriptional regulator
VQTYNFKWKWDFVNDNFDEFVAAHIMAITPEQMQKLPSEIAFKIKKGSKSATGSLSFLQKLYFLYKHRRSRFFVVFEDQEKGFSMQQFEEYRQNFKHRTPSISEAEQLSAEFGFCFGSKEVIESLDYLNMLSVGPAYKYIIQQRNASVRSAKVKNFKESITHIIRMLTFYEANKKRIGVDLGVAVPEWYILMHLYEKESKGSEAYNSKFKGAYNSNKVQLIKALTTLAAKGLIEKFGGNKFASYRITAEGTELVHKILYKYVLDY